MPENGPVTDTDAVDSATVPGSLELDPAGINTAGAPLSGTGSTAAPPPAEHHSSGQLPRHRRLRLPLRLRGELPDRAVRGHRVDVHSAARFAERVHRPAGPGRRLLPGGAVRRRGAGRPPLPAGHAGAGDDLADPDRLADRPRCADHGALAQHRPAVEDAPPVADRLRRRACAAAHHQVHLRQRRPADELRADLRLRPQGREVELPEVGLLGGRRHGQGPADAEAVQLPADRARGPHRDGPHQDAARRRALRRAGVLRPAGAGRHRTRPRTGCGGPASTGGNG